MGFFGDVFDTVFDKTLDVVGDIVEVVATTAIDATLDARDGKGLPGVSAVAGAVAAGAFGVDVGEAQQRDKSNDSAAYKAAAAGWDVVDKMAKKK